VPTPLASVVPLFGVAPASAPAPAFELAPRLDAAWRALPAAARDHLAGFLADAPTARAHVIAPPGAPASFADDLARGGPALRAAFPTLVRHVAAITRDGDRASIRIGHTGAHAGAFFGLVLPTGRAVTFTITHDLRLDGDRVVDDRVTIDLRAIVRQLAAPH
jgi:predicted ester cyclase